jgi:hypothetical protein
MGTQKGGFKMKNTNIINMLTAVMVALLLVAPSAQALTVRGTPVTVMNTAPDGGAIPVTGTVGVSGTVPVTGSVAVTNTVPVTGSVEVTNTVPVSGTVAISGPVTVSGAVTNSENPDRSPYQSTKSVTIPLAYVNQFALFPAQANKRAIYKYISVNCYTPSITDTFPLVELTAYTQDIGRATVKLEKSVQFGGAYWTGSANILIYSDGTTNVNINHSDMSVSPTCGVTLTGHTISNP